MTPSATTNESTWSYWSGMSVMKFGFAPRYHPWKKSLVVTAISQVAPMATSCSTWLAWPTPFA